MSATGDAPRPERPIAIVGGGPGGLTMARVLRALGLPFVLFERNADFGGLWNAADPESPVYDSAHLISSRSMTGFADYPMPEHWPDYPGRDLVCAYIRAFARDEGLYETARLGEGIERAEPLPGGGWRLHTSRGAEEEVRAIVVATGSNWQPMMPDWPGAEGFSGRIRHSVSYRNPAGLEGKRVLIVGLGNTGGDIACDIAPVAARTAISVRRGYHLIPKHIFGVPADVFADRGPPLPLWLRQRIFGLLIRLIVGDLTRHGMPEPDHRLLETHPLLCEQLIHHLRHGDVEILPDVAGFDGDEVVFADGRRERFDEVICATGFAWGAPWLPEGVLPFHEGRLELPLSILTERPDLYAISFAESNSSSFTLFNEMAWVIGRTLAALRDVPAAHARVLAEARRLGGDLRGGLRLVPTPRHRGYVDSQAYRRAIRRLRRRLGWPVRERFPPPARGTAALEALAARPAAEVVAEMRSRAAAAA